MNKDVINVSFWKEEGLTVRVFLPKANNTYFKPVNSYIRDFRHKSQIELDGEVVGRYFKKGTTKQEIEDTIIKAARFFLDRNNGI